jgi:hypothetical protein
MQKTGAVIGISAGLTKSQSKVITVNKISGLNLKNLQVVTTLKGGGGVNHHKRRISLDPKFLSLATPL